MDLEINELVIDNDKLNNTYLCMLVLKYGKDVEEYIKRINNVCPEFFNLPFLEKFSHVRYINEKISPYRLCISADYTTISLYSDCNTPSFLKIKNN